MPLKFCLFFLCGFPILAFTQSQKRALLIGISDYPDKLESGMSWPKLHGREDAQLLAGTLVKQGFDTITLLDKEATKQGIMAALKRLADQAQAGDQLFILFSGHGQQISDNNEWRDEPDGYDECLIPYDCPYYDSTKTYTGDLHLRDDELYQALLLIRQKAGIKGQVFVALDACHSGSANRAVSTLRPNETYRGFSKSGRQSHLDLPNAVRPAGTSSDANRLEEAKTGGYQQNMAPMVAFFATAPGQENREINPTNSTQFGPLSYYLSEGLLKVDAQTSYLQLFEKIQLNISNTIPGQTPTSEGNLNCSVFDGKMLGAITHYLVVNTVQRNFAYLREGELHGLYAGTELAFYPPDTWDTILSKPLYLGHVQKSDGTGALIEVTTKEALKENELTGTWCFVRAFKKEGQALSYQDRVRALRSANFESEALDLEIRLVSFVCDKEDNGRVIRDFGPGEREKDTYRYGDCFTVEIKNNTRREQYFNLLDFPGDQALLLIPDEAHAQQDYSIKPSQTWNSRDQGQLKPWWFDEVGPELFKLVYSDQPIYIGDAIPTRGSGGGPAPVLGGRLVETRDILVRVLPKQ